MSNEQVPSRVTFKCTYCGNPITVTYSQFRFTEICPSCRGSVMIPRPKADSTDAVLNPPVAKESGEWPAAHYAQPGARVIDLQPASGAAPAPATQMDAAPVVPVPPEPPVKAAVPIAVAMAQPPAKAAGPEETTLLKSLAEVAGTEGIRKSPIPSSPQFPSFSTPVSQAAPEAPPVTDAGNLVPPSKFPHVSAGDAPEARTAAAVLPSYHASGSESQNEIPKSTSDEPGTVLLDKTLKDAATASGKYAASKSVEPVLASTAPPMMQDPDYSVYSASAPETSPSVSQTLIGTGTETVGPASEGTGKPTESRMMAIQIDKLTGAVSESPASAASQPCAPEVPHTDAANAESSKPRPPTRIIESVMPPWGAGVVVRAKVFGDFSNAPPTEGAPTTVSPPPVQTMMASAASEYSHASEQQSDPASERSIPATDILNVQPDAMHNESEAAAYDAYIAPRRRAPWALIAASVLVLGGVGYFVYNSIAVGKKREDLKAAIEKDLADAKARYDQNDVQGARSYAATAQNRASDKDGLLDQPVKEAYNNKAKFFADRGAEAMDLEARFKAGSSNPEKLRSALNEKKSVWEAEKSYDTKPMMFLLNNKLAELDEVESGNKLTALQAKLKSADELYKSQKIEEAGAVAKEILDAMPLKPVVNNLELKKRAEVLLGRATLLKAARSDRAGARDARITDVKKQIQAKIDEIDPKDEDRKPLLRSLQALKDELAKDDAAYQEKVKQQELAQAQKAAEEKRAKERKPFEMSDVDSKIALRILHQFRDYDSKLRLGDRDIDGYKFKFDGRDYRFDLHRTAAGAGLLYIEANGNKILLDSRHFDNTDKNFRQRYHRAIYHAMALLDAMKQANVVSDEPWDSKEEAPFVSARRFDKQGNEFIFLGDRLYVGKSQEKTDQQKKMDEEFKVKAEVLALAVEKDEPTTEDVRKTISFAVRASAVEADWNDHLEGEYVRKVIDEGYIEREMPGSSERLKKELAEWRAGYKLIAEPFINYSGVAPEGDATEYRTYEDRAVWRLYDKATSTTTFAITNPDDEKDCLFILYDYPGKLTEMPDINTAATVRMTHQAVGVIATYDTASKKMTYDKEKWDFSTGLELPPYKDSDRVAKGYGTAAWALPPHVLLVDKSGRTKGLVTPYGRVDPKDFKKIADPAERKAAIDKYMDELITVMPDKPEGIYQHLYFRYFFQYILDSPVTDHIDLLGSRAHVGDIHQTAYQSLERFMGGRYVGDCDDIAELYMVLTRKMGKLSYVMSLPGHAACGWVEKVPNGSDYVFQILQTGPPRRFVENSLDKVVEDAYRAFDEQGTAHFDIKSLPFNFRFNDEPTRTTYWLSSRMYVDAKYGEAMERVQSYWHFHFYALGIETMKAMIEKGDTVAENYNEIAGLYGQVREVEKSIEMSRQSIKHMKEDEKLSRMSEEFRIASMWRSEHDNDKSYDAIKKTVDELKKIQQAEPNVSFEYLGMRMQVANLLVSLDRPWEAWDLLKPDIEFLSSSQFNNVGYLLKIEHMGTPTTIYLKMKDLMEGKDHRKALTPVEMKQFNELGKILDTFYSRGKSLFEESDGLDDWMRKYAFVGIYYAGKFGRKKYLEELMKDGPYPADDKRDHMNRTNSKAIIDEDWKWIRMSLSSYSIGIGDAIDLDDPAEKWRIQEAVGLCDQMQKVAKVATKFGSLGNSNFELLSNRVLRAFLVKDW